jgi:hypothetical protein
MGHTDPHGLRLSLGVVCGKRVVLLRWKFGPLGPIEEGTDLTRNFTFVNECQLNDEPTVISVYDTGLQGSVRMCYTNKHGTLFVADLATNIVRHLSISLAQKVSKCACFECAILFSLNSVTSSLWLMATRKKYLSHMIVRSLMNNF